MGQGGFPVIEVPPAYHLNLLKESPPFQHVPLGARAINI